MKSDLFENLLNESESDYLDFKQEEYRFEGGSDEEKSELLKDILAFTNAWRRTDAYILIGVKELKGARSEVVGISKHIDDASLQQFVNSKVQKPISFSYNPYEFKGKQVGIIHIPIQDRPFYLRLNYGKLKKNVVYLRRGSSTDEATPDEIAKMGLPNINSSQIQIPTLDCEFADPEKRRLYSTQIEIVSGVLSLPPTIPHFVPPTNPFGLNLFYSGDPNRNYYRDLYKFFDYLYLLKPVSLRLKNTGRVIAYNVRVEIDFDADGLVITTKSNLPDRPKKYFNILLPTSDRVFFPAIEPLGSGVKIDHHENTWKISIDYGNIQPKAEGWLNEIFFIGSRKSQSLQVEAVLFADNTPDPIRLPLSVGFLIKNLSLTLDDLVKNYDDFFNEQIISLDEGDE